MRSIVAFKISDKMLSTRSIENIMKRVIEANLEKLDTDALFTWRTNDKAA